MPPDVLIHGDTHRTAALRHELPLGIIDAFSYFELDGRRVAIIASMESGRVAEVAPDVEVIDPYELSSSRTSPWGRGNESRAISFCSRPTFARVKRRSATSATMSK